MCYFLFWEKVRMPEEVDLLLSNLDEQSKVSDVHQEIADIFGAQKGLVDMVVLEEEEANKRYGVIFQFEKTWKDGEFQSLKEKFIDSAFEIGFATNYFQLNGVGSTPSEAAQAILDEVLKQKNEINILLGFNPSNQNPS
jgi:hypothetical protein